MGSLTPINLLKNAVNKMFWSYDRYNSDQTAVENSINKLIASTVDGDSGADNVAMTPISDTGAADTVQEVIEALITILKASTDNTSGADFVKATSVSGLTGNSVQALIESLKAYFDTALTTHKTSGDHDGQYFTETELGKFDGTGGATLIGNAPIAGIPGTNVHDQLIQLRALLDQFVAGQIPDGSLARIKLEYSTKLLLDGLEQALIEAQTDFDLYVTAGRYFINATMTNTPFGASAACVGTLDVIKVDSTRLIQIYYKADSGDYYIRQKNSSGAFIAWVRLYLSTDIVTEAVAAQKLKTARAITLSGDVTGTANFDGSAGITITAVVADDSHAHIIANVDGLQAALDAKTDDTEVSTTAIANKLLKLDANAKLPASITGSADGNAGTATKLATARTITLNGDVSGSATFDGSANAAITVVVGDDTHNHIIANVDGLQAALDAKADDTEFTQSFVQNGWIKHKGLIIQWGSITVTTSGMAWTYPIAFPNAVLNVQVTVNQNTPTATIAAVTPLTTNVNFISNVQVNAMAVAIGY